MCIRDRLYAINARTGEIAWESRLGVSDELPEGKRDTGRLNICLLYTSDAADERTRVDLGGCRTIKKKEKKEKKKEKKRKQHNSPQHIA